MMHVIVPLFAEVGDKVPRLPVLFLWSAGIVLLVWALSRKMKWAAVIPLPLAILFALGSSQEPRDDFVGPAIIHELGYGYVLLAYVAAVLPFIAIAVFVSQRKKA